MTISNPAPTRTPKKPAGVDGLDRLPDRRGRLTRLLAAALIGVLLAGCATTASPGQEAPALESALHRVDTAVAAGHLHHARTEVNTLITDTKQARQRGDISGSQAVQILAAARSVLAQLPSTTPRPSASPKPSPSPSESNTSTTQAGQKSSGPGTGHGHHKTKPAKKPHGKPPGKKKGGGRGPK